MRGAQLVVVIAGGLALVGAVALVERMRTAPSQTDRARRSEGDADRAAADAGIDAVNDGRVDAAGNPIDDASELVDASVHIDVALPPWFVESRTVDRGIGACGGMESTAYQSLRYATDAGSSSIHFATIDQSCPHGTAEDFIAKAIFDYDGDGSPELLLVKEKTGPVGVTEEQSSIWTRRGGRIMRYEPPDASPLREFSDIVDADQDGRPDLASRRTFDNIVDRCGGGTGFAVAPIFLLHSAKNGTFIARDDVTRSYFEDKCSGTLEEQLESADGDIATAIACARVRGASPAAIERTLRKGCTTFSDDACDLALDDDSGKRRVCPTWVLTLTKQTI